MQKQLALVTTQVLELVLFNNNLGLNKTKKATLMVAFLVSYRKWKKLVIQNNNNNFAL